MPSVAPDAAHEMTGRFRASRIGGWFRDRHDALRAGAGGDRMENRGRASDGPRPWTPAQPVAFVGRRGTSRSAAREPASAAGDGPYVIQAPGPTNHALELEPMGDDGRPGTVAGGGGLLPEGMNAPLYNGMDTPAAVQRNAHCAERADPPAQRAVASREQSHAAVLSRLLAPDRGAGRDRPRVPSDRTA
jgi:hypothetical protein